jgi:ketosteroid isomerase-like protein
MASHVQVVKAAYEAFGRRDIPGLLALFDPGIEWRLAEGHPYAPHGQPWRGPAAIARSFFTRSGEEWDGFGVSLGELHEVGDAVVVECRYTGTYKATGRALDAQVCHVWKVSDGKITSFRQYIDTAQLQAVMGTRPLPETASA